MECALAAQSSFIVSGDTKDVLPVGSFKGIPIVTVAEFNAWLDQHLTH